MSSPLSGFTPGCFFEGYRVNWYDQKQVIRGKVLYQGFRWENNSVSEPKEKLRKEREQGGQTKGRRRQLFKTERERLRIDCKWAKSGGGAGGRTRFDNCGRWNHDVNRRLTQSEREREDENGVRCGSSVRKIYHQVSGETTTFGMLSTNKYSTSE